MGADIRDVSPSCVLLGRGGIEPDNRVLPCRVAKLLEDCPRELACAQAALPAALAPCRSEAPSAVRALPPPPSPALLTTVCKASQIWPWPLGHPRSLGR